MHIFIMAQIDDESISDVSRAAIKDAIICEIDDFEFWPTGQDDSLVLTDVKVTINGYAQITGGE